MPFLDLTANMDIDTRKKVANRMVRTATTVALVLVVLGAFLMKLLHFSEPALYIAGGIVFLLVALRMLAEAGEEEEGHHEKASGRDAEKMALYPLAVPYLLNPAGITLLVIFSGAIPFDAPGVELGHHDGKCSFETILEDYGLTDRALPPVRYFLDL